VQIRLARANNTGGWQITHRRRERLLIRYEACDEWQEPLFLEKEGKLGDNRLLASLRPAKD
jgi:hypothetical protein